MHSGGNKEAFPYTAIKSVIFKQPYSIYQKLQKLINAQKHFYYRSAMKVLMFTDQEIWDILKILAALLHMGNIKYKGKVIDNLDATDIPDQTNVERVAAILGVNTKALISALTSKTLFAHGKT